MIRGGFSGLWIVCLKASQRGSGGLNVLKESGVGKQRSGHTAVSNSVYINECRKCVKTGRQGGGYGRGRVVEIYDRRDAKWMEQREQQPGLLKHRRVGG